MCWSLALWLDSFINQPVSSACHSPVGFNSLFQLQFSHLQNDCLSEDPWQTSVWNVFGLIFISAGTTMLIRLQLREKRLLSLTRPLCVICQSFSVVGRSEEQGCNWLYHSERFLIKPQSNGIYSRAFNDLARMCHGITKFTWANVSKFAFRAAIEVF